MDQETIVVYVTSKAALGASSALLAIGDLLLGCGHVFLVGSQICGRASQRLNRFVSELLEAVAS